MYKYLFGPVNSRRLGLSLGIDMVPAKYCNLNCIYCESGKTTHHTNSRGQIIASDQITKELQSYLQSKPKLDYITFSGAGEPTLNIGIDKVVTFIKTKYPQYKIALITNGILFANKDVRTIAGKFDLVMPSLDSVRQESFNKINRPHSSIKLFDYLEGLKSFANSFKKDLWLEIFMLEGVNDSSEDIEAMKSFLMEFNTTKIQLNTLDRPGTVKGLRAMPYEKLQTIKETLGFKYVEIISRKPQNNYSRKDDHQENIENKILETIKRRPQTLNDLSVAFGVSENSLRPTIKMLIQENKLTESCQGGDVFYQLSPNLLDKSF